MQIGSLSAKLLPTARRPFFGLVEYFRDSHQKHSRRIIAVFVSPTVADTAQGLSLINSEYAASYSSHIRNGAGIVVDNKRRRQTRLDNIR